MSSLWLVTILACSFFVDTTVGLLGASTWSPVVRKTWVSPAAADQRVHEMPEKPKKDASEEVLSGPSHNVGIRTLFRFGKRSGRIAKREVQDSRSLFRFGRAQEFDTSPDYDIDARAALFRFGKRQPYDEENARSLFRFGKRYSAENTPTLFRFGRDPSSRSLFRFGKRDFEEDDQRTALFRFGKRVPDEEFENDSEKVKRNWWRTLMQGGKRAEPDSRALFRFGKRSVSNDDIKSVMEEANGEENISA